MASPTMTQQTKPLTREEAVTRLRQLRQLIDERNRDLDDDARELLVDRLASEIAAGAAQRARDRLQRRPSSPG